MITVYAHTTADSWADYKMRNKDEKQGKKALIALITNLPLIGRMLNYMEWLRFKIS